jgi:hypothetical protein
VSKSRRVVYWLWDHVDRFLQRFDPAARAMRDTPVVPIRVRFETYDDGEWREVSA